MTAQKPQVEYGVRYQHSDGKTFVAAGYTLAGAAYMALLREVKDCDPRPVAVVSRTVSEWAEIPSERKT